LLFNGKIASVHRQHTMDVKAPHILDFGCRHIGEQFICKVFYMKLCMKMLLLGTANAEHNIYVCCLSSTSWCHYWISKWWICKFFLYKLVI